MHLTKRTIENLRLPAGGQAFHRDSQLKGLAVRVTAGGTKAFVLEKLVRGRVRRITLGRVGEISLDHARKLAQRMLGQIADGRDPAEERRRTAAAAVTLDDVFRDYLAQRSLKPKTVSDYERAITVAFADWRRRPLAAITREAVERRFNRLRDENGPAWANLCMRVLRAILNFAAGKYADERGQSPFAGNVVRVLNDARMWARVDRRRTVIAPHQLAAWYQGVASLDNTTVRDYLLLLLLFTGLRRREGARLRWSDVDLVGKTLTVTDTKNHQPHTLPLPDFLFDLLSARQETRINDFVFPGDGAHGHLIDPKKAKTRVIEAAGVAFTLHDLRRTFATVAESLDIPGYALKRLLNHSPVGDVTGGYIVITVERLRAPMQAIADCLLRAMGIEHTEIHSFAAQPNATPTAAYTA
jgi:integrase